jgi:RHS repeat-associated protein
MTETIAADEFTGAFSLGVALSLPRARGSRPALDLRYRSSSGNGPFGLGFAVAIDAVARSTTRRAPRYTRDDVFTHSGFGELVYLPGADQQVERGGQSYAVRSYRPRQEEDFPGVQWWISPACSYWVITDRNNVTSVYGADPTSRVTDPTDQERVFEWLLVETFDARGNHVIYEYRPENGAGLSAAASRAARYPGRISWGNMKSYAGSLVLTAPVAELAGFGWHFQAIFDYGPFDYEQESQGAWAVRADPFISYSAGFAIGTYRLCRSIRTLHHFPAELGPDPVPVSCLRLSYDQSPYGSMLTQVEQIGYRTGSDGRLLRRSLAPIELTWSGFDERDADWIELDFGTRAGSDLAPDDDLRWVDLDGTGVPGLLNSGAGGIRFWAPRRVDPIAGGIRYAEPRLIRSVPTGAAVADDALTLADPLGTGRLQWLDTTPGSAGYAELRPDGSAGPLHPFDGFPSDYGDPAAALVNVTGTGLPDLVLIGDTDVQWHASLGAAGYGPRRRVPGGGLPPASDDQPGEARRFADALGAGDQQWVRVRNGSVTCWPSLGYGRFGDPVELVGAPYLEPDFDPGRLYLLDLDGSGACDLGYRYPHAVRIWRNQSGNGFAAPFDIPLPPGTDASARVDFADLLGTGTSCLIVTQPYPAVRHWAYIFGRGDKPYLLTGTDSGTGERTRITYTTSARQQISDPPPPSSLPRVPFPVHVVARLRVDDLLSDTSSVQTFRYGHGFYDPVECTFTGFGYVERQDAQSPIAGDGPPPLLVRTWYHTGAAPGGGSLESLYRAEYFGGDPRRYPLAESVLAVASGAEATRQALVSLAGQPLHMEFYGLDGSPAQELPYRVDEFRYLTSQLPPDADADAGPVSFHSRLLESVTYDYERNPADPRVGHTMLLATDEYGHITDECHLSYPRRSTADVPAQAELIGYRGRHAYLNVTAGFRLLGVPAEDLNEQLVGLLPGADGYLTPGELSAQLVSGALSGTVTEWARYRYQPGPLQPPQAGGGAAPVGPQRLLASVSYAEHDRTTLERAYAGALSAAELATLLAGSRPAGCALVAAAGGSVIPGAPDPARWWWNPGDALSYAGADRFYRRRSSRDPFGGTVTVVDDPYHLFAAEVTDQLGNTTVAVPDYQALDYCRITDPNGSVAEFGFDPLGLVEATSRRGSEGGRQAGFPPLAGWQAPPEPSPPATVNADPAGYLRQAATAFAYDPLAWTGSITADVLRPFGADTSALWADLVDRGYLSSGGAITKRFRDAYRHGHVALSAPFAAVREQLVELIAAVPGGNPVVGLLLTAICYPTVGNAGDDGDGDGDGIGDGEGNQILTQLSYYDGSLRVLQVKQSTGVPEDPWLASGTVRYDAKGQTRRQFEPYYCGSAQYDSVEAAAKLGVSSVLHYDALGRLVRTDTPLGTFRAIVYGWDRTVGGSPWAVAAYDENDTLLLSEYYARLMAAVAPDPAEKQVVEQAALCVDSPLRQCLDPAGRAVATISQDAAVVTVERLRSFGAQAAQLLSALTAVGYLDDQGRFTVAFRSFQPGWTVSLPPPFDAEAATVTALLAALQRRGTLLPTETVLDPLGNPARINDARLGPAGRANVVSTWSLAGYDVHTISADAGPHWRLRNAAGNVVWERDGLGCVTVTGYDELQRVASEQIAHADNSSYQCLLAIYGDSLDGTGHPYFADPSRWNLRGQPVLALDDAGLTLTPFRTILGLPCLQRRTLTPAHTSVPDWGKLPADQLTQLASALAQFSGPDQLPGLVLPAALRALLEPAGYTEQAGYDALGRQLLAIDADGNRLDYTLDHRDLLLGARLKPPGHDQVTLGPVGYDAHGRPVSLTAAGTLRSSYRYSPVTFELVGVRTVASSGAVLQDLTYYRDPVGNVGQLRNAAAAGLPAPATPASFRYDPLYRLVAAIGREAAAGQEPVPYRAEYAHDAGGNLVSVHHEGATSWQRTFAIAADSNRLAVDARYDGNGSVLSCPEASDVSWTDHYQIASLSTPPAADGSVSREFNTYAGDRRRLRSVRQYLPGTGAKVPPAPMPTATEEVRTIGLLEIVRQTDSAGHQREWHATTVTAGPLQLGRWVCWVANAADPVPAPAMRYPLLDTIGSITSEVGADGQPRTYREYLPFGGDALSWSASALDDEMQRRRYSGKESDPAGLYYYGARHYSPALLRWMSPDPAGTADSLNLYQFVGGNPVTFADAGGQMKVRHWNVHNKTTATIAEASFVNELASLLGSNNYVQEGTVVFLTEIMHSVSDAAFGQLVTKLRRKTGVDWTGKVINTGMSEGGTRRERIAILTSNVDVQDYWQLVRPTINSTRYTLERQARNATGFNGAHQANSRYPVGVRVSTKLSGEDTLLDIGGYHNQGPGAGAGTRAQEVINAAIAADVHLLTGDFNTEPPAKRARTSMDTRRSSLQDSVVESNVATSQGGSYYDRTVVTNNKIGRRILTVKNGTGNRSRSSDHADNTAVLGTRSKRGRGG